MKLLNTIKSNSYKPKFSKLRAACGASSLLFFFRIFDRPSHIFISGLVCCANKPSNENARWPIYWLLLILSFSLLLTCLFLFSLFFFYLPADLGARQSRKPWPSSRLPGSYLMRNAARPFLASMNQAPPRATRAAFLFVISFLPPFNL